MFTGLVEEVGKIKSIKKNVKSMSLVIGAKKVLEDIKLGDSIMVNGICLTTTAFSNDDFTVDVMNVTIKASSFNDIKVNMPVNLERALRLSDRLGGHIVTGHIDDTGVIKKIEKDDNAFWITVKASKEILDLIVPKGSITLDGISLTVAKLDYDTFSVSIIPHTYQNTNLKYKIVGSTINVENDYLGKYVEKLINKNKTTTDKRLLNLL